MPGAVRCGQRGRSDLHRSAQRPHLPRRPRIWVPTNSRVGGQDSQTRWPCELSESHTASTCFPAARRLRALKGPDAGDRIKRTCMYDKSDPRATLAAPKGEAKPGTTAMSASFG